MYTNTPIKTSKDVLKLVRFLDYTDREASLAVHLDGTNCVIKTRIVDEAGDDPLCRQIYRNAIEDGASAIILVHNHPSGSCVPSIFDRGLALEVRMAGEMLGIPMQKHLLITRHEYAEIKDAQ